MAYYQQQRQQHQQQQFPLQTQNQQTQHQHQHQPHFHSAAQPGPNANIWSTQPPHSHFQQNPYSAAPGSGSLYDTAQQQQLPPSGLYSGYGSPSHAQHLSMPPPLSPVRQSPSPVAGLYDYATYASASPSHLQQTSQPLSASSSAPAHHHSYAHSQPPFSPQAPLRQHVTNQPQAPNDSAFDRDDPAFSDNGVCYATDQGGLRGKIKLSRDGKHSFVDLEGTNVATAANASSSSPHLYSGIGTGAGASSNSLSRSLLELAKTEKARIKAERLLKERESSRTKSMADRRAPATVNNDAFNKLMIKEQKSRSKYHISERTLLEEERARYARLEEAYDKLLTQVQQLQATHLQDIRNTETRFHTASTSLQKALVIKSEESISLSNQLANVQARYERDMREWAKDRATLLSKVELTETAWKEADATLQDREKKVAELGRLRKDLSERVAVREQELIKYAKALREREGDWMREKETRMKAEVKALKLEETLAERDSETKQLKDSLEKKQSELEELQRVRSMLNETRREVEDLTRREKNYLAEIEQTAARERKLFNEVEELASQQRKYVGEISRLTSRQSSMLQDVELAKSIEIQLRHELEEAMSKNAQQNQDLNDLEKQARQFQGDNARLMHDVSEMQAVLHDLRLENQSLDKELAQMRIMAESLKSEKDALLAQRTMLENERESKNREVDDLHVKINEIGMRLESELHAKAEMRQQNKDKLVSVSQRITELQNTLSETQLQLQDLRENESLLRQTVRQREDTIRAQNQSIVELQSKLSDAQSQSSKEAQEYEAFKAKKREEIVSIQDKFNNAKNAMEQEVGSLRSQLQQKLTQLTVTSEESSKLKVEMSELSADRFSLEARVSELLASEASYQRQISNLQITINQKNQDIARLTSKQQALAEQLKRLDDEMHAYRANVMAANTRDNEITRLQSNMEEISKRLKSQVDLLLDRDMDNARAAASPTGGAVSTSQETAAANAISPGARGTRAADPTGSSMLFGNSGAGGSGMHSRGGSSAYGGDRNVTFSPTTPGLPASSVGTNLRATSRGTAVIGGSYSAAPASSATTPNNASSSAFPRSLEREASRKIVGIDDFEDMDRLGGSGVRALQNPPSQRVGMSAAGGAGTGSSSNNREN